MPTRNIEQVLDSIDQLRPMPSSVTRILRALDQPQISAGIVSEMIGLDQALAALVLRMANSAGLGYGKECTSLADAVVRLGFRRVRTLVLAAAASGPLTTRLTGYRLGAGELWNHSVATAMAAQWLGNAVHYPDPGEAYVAGLLHDMGKLILDQFVQVDYPNMLQSIQHDHISLSKAEENQLGIDHANVGSLMAQKWNFPVHLVEAIRYHHAPTLAFENQRLAAIMNVANSFAQREVIGLVDLYGSVIHPEAMRVLNLDETKLQRLKKDMEQSQKMGAQP